MKALSKMEAIKIEVSCKKCLEKNVNSKIGVSTRKYLC